jgi:hypothetical protein
MTDDGTSNKDRGFNLEDEILAEFEFLTEDYGFRVRQVNREWPCWVRYESEKVFVFVADERMHYDLYVSVGLLETTFHTHERSYSIQNIMEVAEAAVPSELWSFQTSSNEVARKLLHRIADYLRENGRPALEGDAAFYKQLESRNSQWFLLWQVEDVRRRAQEAWERRDYRKATELYGAVARHLTPAEEKKRLYCIRNLERG